MKELAIAKLIYLEGIKYSRYDSLINNKLAILNFDLSAATLTMAVCINKGKGKDTLTPKGSTKYFPQLLEVLLTIDNYNDDNQYIFRLNKLHILRNNIQHGDEHPSFSTIEEYKLLIRQFFDDILNKLYSKSISFESISPTKLLKSTNEQILIELVEDLITKINYPRAHNLLIISFLYRYALIRENTTPKSLIHYQQQYVYPYKQRQSQGNIDPLQEQLLSLYNGIKDSLTLIALEEYYYKLNEILKREIPHVELENPDMWISQMTTTNNSIGKDRVERLYEDLCTFLFDTEKLILVKRNYSPPIFYDVYVNNITKTSANINFKVLSILNIIEFQIYLNNNKLNTTDFTLGKGILELRNLESNKLYTCTIYMTQEKGEYCPIQNYAMIPFKTL